MKRLLATLLLLAGMSLNVGCCCFPCNPGMGCGPTYWGAYADDPPTCEPCTSRGIWLGKWHIYCNDPCACLGPGHVEPGDLRHDYHYQGYHHPAPNMRHSGHVAHGGTSCNCH